ncbi:hypothetical protein ACKWTF_007390 [Chironomus riparius]
MTRYLSNDTKLQNEILEEVSDYCGKPVTHPSKDEFTAPYIWSFYHAFFFSFTVCSTVGYGNIAPSNTTGRMFLIFYGLVGLPVHAILFAYMGNFWGNTFVKLYRRYKEYKMAMDKHWVPKKVSLIGQISLYLFPGIVLFIFAPAILFSYFEGWDYSISVYYTFVTLTTIGFGDFVPTFQNHQEREYGIYFILYELFIVCWFIAGVSYIAMIIGFLIKGLRSKKVKRIEHNLAINIKETQKKIWSGVQRDVGYIRKILNEVYFLKFKPVYKDRTDARKKLHIPRSESCPNLSIEDADEFEEEMMILNRKLRKRAFSECTKIKQTKKPLHGSITITRPQSDSDLSFIDREKTFATQSQQQVEPGELLAKLSVALSEYRNGYPNHVGFSGFSDSEILADEANYSNMSIATSTDRYPHSETYARSRRAFSEVCIPIEKYSKDSNEWTWCGANTQINEIEKIRSQVIKPNMTHKTSLQNEFEHFPHDLEINLKENVTKKSLLQKFNIFKKRNSDAKKYSIQYPNNPLHYEHKNSQEFSHKERINNMDDMSSYRYSKSNIFTIPCHEEEQDLLETTTMADVIRAIEMLHTDKVTTENSQGKSIINSMHRRLGTDHLYRNQNLLLLNKKYNSSHTIHSPGQDVSPIMINKRQRIYSCVAENIYQNRNNTSRKFSDVDSLRKSVRIVPNFQASQNSPMSTVKHRFSIRPVNLNK